MSIEALAWAKKQEAGTPVGKLILVMLADYADRDGRAFAGQKKLADECECHERIVRKWLAIFEERGLIEREARRRKSGSRTSDMITLRLDQPAAEAGDQPASESEVTGSKSRAILTYQSNLPPTPQPRRRRDRGAGDEGASGETWVPPPGYLLQADDPAVYAEAIEISGKAYMASAKASVFDVAVVKLAQERVAARRGLRLRELSSRATPGGGLEL